MAFDEVDARDLRVCLPKEPRRILALVPSLTELLFALGLGDRVIAVTRFCTEPPEGIAPLPRIGGQKNPDTAKILSLRPDLVIANREENRGPDVETMEAGGVPVFVTYPRSVLGAIRMIRAVGSITGREAVAEAITARIETAVEEVQRRVAGLSPIRVFCPIWKRPYMSINSDTYVHDVLRLAGGVNVCADLPDRYPRVTLEEVAARLPEVILLPDEPYRFRAKDLADFTPFGDIPAVRDGRVLLVDGKSLTWYGPRIGDSLRRIMDLLHG